MNHTLKQGRYLLRLHTMEPVCRKTALKLLNRIKLDPPAIPSWAELWRIA